MARILVADDDRIVRFMLQEMLEANGHDVSFAGDGLQAVEYFRAEPYDLLITDIAMPNRNGLWAIDQIKQEYSWAKIIAISGKDALQLGKAEELGACEVLVKPLVPREVQDAVYWALSSCGVRSEQSLDSMQSESVG